MSEQAAKYFRVKIWGARGSLPSPLLPAEVESLLKDLLRDFSGQYLGQCDPEKIKSGSVIVPVETMMTAFLDALPRYRLGGYGGNTPCMEVTSPEQQIIIDGGSGIRPLGYEMMKGPSKAGKAEIHIFFTHFHWDHLIGLPFFTPIFIPGNVIHLYAVQPELPDVFKTLFKKPYFPVPLEKLESKLVYHTLRPRETIRLGDIQVTPYQLDHPDPCWGFKMECGGKVYSHCVDTECIRVSPKELGEDLPLYQGVDTMIFDAQYTLMESIEKVNWGHASATLGLDIAMREGIKRVVFMHHDPASSNQKIAAAESQTLRYYRVQLKHARSSSPFLHEVECLYAHEGMVLDI